MSVRVGLVTKKIGMSCHYTADGFRIPVTLLAAYDCQVVAVKTEETDGYNAVQVGAFSIKAKNVTKPLKGHFAKAKVEPKRKLVEFRVTRDALIEVGKELSPSHFIPGQFVDAVGTSKGKGFAGGMKRHNFRGLEETHGVSVSHRSHGSTGQCQDPGKVFKGKKMAGHLGSERVTIQNLEVISVDPVTGYLCVCGAVPGANGDYVIISDAIKRSRPANAPFPAAFKEVAASKVKSEEADVSKEVVENNEVDAAPADQTNE